MLGIVIQPDHDQAARAVENSRRIAAPRIVQIIHFACIAASEPFRESCKLFERLCRTLIEPGRRTVYWRHSAEFESLSSRTLTDPPGSVFRIHGLIMPRHCRLQPALQTFPH